MISVDDVSQFCVVWVSACSMGAGIYAHILLPRPESTAALVQTAVNLKGQVSKSQDSDMRIQNKSVSKQTRTFSAS